MALITRKPKKKKQTKVAFLRSWLIPEGFSYTNLRYKSPPEKGIYWYWFSLFVRERDVNTYGTCISCGRQITVEGSQAGHFMPAANCGRDLLFDPINVNAECPGCNAFDETHLLGYAEELDRRYGEGTSRSLRNRREEYRTGGVVKDFSAEHYRTLILSLPNFQKKLSTGDK